MLICKGCHRFPCKCGQYAYVRSGWEATAFCPNDGNGLEVQSADGESTVFGACPLCRTEWERMPDGSFVVFEPGTDPFV